MEEQKTLDGDTPLRRLMAATGYALRAAETAMAEQAGKGDIKALKDMTGILKDLLGIVRELYGLPDSHREDKTVQVVFEAGEDRWNE